MKKIFEGLLLALNLSAMVIPAVSILFLPPTTIRIATIVEVIVILLMSALALIYILIDSIETKNK